MGRKLSARKAQCMVCEGQYIVRNDGHIRQHIVPGSYPTRRCEGGGVLAEGFEWMKKDDEPKEWFDAPKDLKVAPQIQINSDGSVQ